MTPNFFQYLEQFAYLKNYPVEEQNDTYQLSISKVPDISQINNEDIEHLNNLYNSLSLLDTCMFPLKNSGIPFELGVTGGSIYDFLTGNTSLVKDYDLTLHFPIYPQKPEFEIINAKFKEEDIAFKGSHFDLLSQQYQAPMHKLFKTYMPEKALGKYIPKDLVYFVQELLKANVSKIEPLNIKRNIKDYRNEQIQSIFKIEDSNFSKPIDLIINKTNTNYFCSAFDFNLCKTYINYEPLSNVELTKEQVANHMLKNLFIFPEAVHDLHNHTLTMDLTKQSFKLDHIEYFMERHFPRLEEKLPNFRLSFKTNDNTQPEYKSWTDNYWHDYLERKISRNPPTKEKKKLKI